MQEDKAPSNSSVFLEVFEFALSFGFTISLPIIAGLLAGLWLDKGLETQGQWTIRLLCLGILFGTLAGFTLLARILRHMKQNDTLGKKNRKSVL